MVWPEGRFHQSCERSALVGLFQGREDALLVSKVPQPAMIPTNTVNSNSTLNLTMRYDWAFFMLTIY